MWQYKYTGQAEHLFNKMSAEIILKYCKDFDMSLELGCGTGQLSRLLMYSDKYFHASLVDSSPTSFKYVADYFKQTGVNNENFSFHNQSIISFGNTISQLTNRMYDMVMSSGLIEHFKDVELKELCNIHKLLSNKYIVIIVPADNPENNAEAKTERHIKKYGYEKPMDEKTLDNLFIGSTFSHVHSERFYKNGKLLIAIYERT